MSSAASTSPPTSTNLPHPPWHTMYRAFSSVVEGILKRCAAAAYSKVKDNRAVESAMENERNAAQQFQSSPPSAAPPMTTSPPVPEHHTTTSNMSETHRTLNDASSSMWGFDECRPKQIKACDKLLHNPTSSGKLLVVDRTGGGKSHILKLAGVMVNGIILVLVPLLALTADQMANIINTIQEHGSVEAQHLDDLTLSQLRDDIVPRIDKIKYNSSLTMFIFTSPQQLVEHPFILDAILRCHARQTLRLVTIDEAHLYAMHGRSFRVAMRVLQRILFEVIFKEGVWHPLLLAMTATMTIPLLESFSAMTNVDWNADDGNSLWDKNATCYRQTLNPSDSDTLRLA